jgi:NAD(P)H-dependent nitrite reductase small subunit
MNSPRWSCACLLADIYPDTGVCALIADQQVALFRVRGGVFAIGNKDPASGANVLARGIVGDMAGELVVASPIYKHHFSLISGQCLEEPSYSVPVYHARIIDNHVWVRMAAMPARRPAATRRLVVIGNGTAALRTLEELIEFKGQPYRIVVIGADAENAARSDWFEQQGITLHTGDPVVRIDRIHRVVHSSRGIEAGYDRLLIATGAHPLHRSLPGENLLGVATLRDQNDLEAVLVGAQDCRCAVVIGGTSLGLQAASELARRGLSVALVHDSARLMQQQLDGQAAELLRSELETRGIRVSMSARAEAILGEDRATGVQISDGPALSAQLVVMACETRPNIELARSAGLPCGRGILVDDTLQSFDPAIYAVGECVEHRGATYELVAPLREQARVCAAHLAERGVRRYGKLPLSNDLPLGGAAPVLPQGSAGRIYFSSISTV